MSESTKSRSSGKPQKPYADFPLTLHGSGRFCKRVNKETHYFGRWGNKVGDEVVPVDDFETAAAEALEKFNREWPTIIKGRKPEPVPDVLTCTMRELCNDFLASKRALVNAGELSVRSFMDYERTTDLVIETFGKERRVETLGPADFERLRLKVLEKWDSVNTRKNTLNRCRIIFRFASEMDLIDKPIKYRLLKGPTKKAIQRARNAKSERLFESHELRMILDALDGREVTPVGDDKPIKQPADPILKAMVLLGINGGYGNTDCATLPESAVSLATGWVSYPRPKTEVPRKFPLWPETAEALRAALALRPKAAKPEWKGNVFLTPNGAAVVRVQPTKKNDQKFTPIDVLAQKFSRLLHRLNINGRSGLGFYTLRHCFETIGGDSRDQVSVDFIMGHAPATDDMAAIYRERIGEDRLRDVVNVVRRWLWPETAEVTP